MGSSGRAVIATRSPLTNVFIDTYIGGDWGHDLRRAGFDAIRVHGASESWVRLDIHDQEVRLVDATPLVGASTWVTEQRIASVQGSDVNTMSIGPGGERGSRIASPIVDGRRRRSWWDGRAVRVEGTQGDLRACHGFPEMGGRSKIGGGGGGSTLAHGEAEATRGSILPIRDESRADIRLGISPHAHGQLCIDHGSHPRSPCPSRLRWTWRGGGRDRA